MFLNVDNPVTFKLPVSTVSDLTLEVFPNPVIVTAPVEPLKLILLPADKDVTIPTPPTPTLPTPCPGLSGFAFDGFSGFGGFLDFPDF